MTLLFTYSLVFAVYVISHRVLPRLEGGRG